MAGKKKSSTKADKPEDGAEPETEGTSPAESQHGDKADETTAEPAAQTDAATESEVSAEAQGEDRLQDEPSEELSALEPADEAEGRKAEEPAAQDASEDSAIADAAEGAPRDESHTDETKAEPLGEERAAWEPDDVQAPEDARAAETTQAPPAPMPEGPRERVVERRGGFIPMVLGGVLAAVIGFALARYVVPEGWPVPRPGDASPRAEITQRLDNQAAQLAELDARVAALSEGPDLSGLEGAQESLDAALQTLADRVTTLDSRLGEVESQMSDMESRLAEIAARPAAEGEAPGAAALEEYQREVEALRDAVEDQRAEMADLAERAREREEEALESAQQTLQRAALTRIQTALDSGTGFAPALADLREAGVTPPDALASVAESGVPSMSELQESFPEDARAALSAARQAQAGDGEGVDVGGYLRSVLGMRSLEPQEGDSPDAILSRAEAALGDGRLSDALAEIETLPEAGREKFAAWVERAQRRQEAISAAEALAEKLNG